MKNKYKLLFIAVMAWQIIAAQNVTIQVDASLGNKSISPYIYGKNNNISDDPGNPTSFTQWQLMREAGLRFTRENGGNNATKYNWRKKISSHPDWYNNVYSHDWDYAAKKLQDSLPGVQGMWAFQLIGFSASNLSNNFDDWSYNNSVWWSGVCQNLAGGGVPNNSGGCAAQTNGNTNLYLENWNADSTVGILDHWFGTNGLGYNKNDILYWSMDNEPDIWNSTHDDVMPTQPAAETFMQLYFAAAKKARAKYPNIKLCGPVPASEWQWYSWNNNKITVGTQSYVWLEFFIKRISEEEAATGIRLLDVIDLHSYPNESNDSDIVQLHRIYFDTTYNYPGANGVKTTSPSGWDNSITKEYVFGRCNQWLNQYMGPNHGVTFAVSEYGANNNNANVTSVSYASMLGTFADNGVEYFSPWYWYPGMWETLHLFSRYGKTTRVQSASNDELYVSSYSSINAAGDSMTVILLNRSLASTKNTTVNISGFTTPNGNYNTLQLKQLPSTETFVSHINNALNSGNVSVNSNSFTLSLPPLSTTAVILSGQALTGVSENSDNKFHVSLSPNPTRGIFSIHSSEKIISLEIINVLGEKIYEQASLGFSNSNQTEIRVDLSGNPNGIYFLHLNTAAGIINKKLILNH